jgi:uncharacterized protein YbjT (DUF2867 family)
MKAFVAGATGETGRRIVEELVGRNISVRCLVRDLEQAKQVLPPKAELVVGNVLQPESLAKAIVGCDVVLCATGARPSFNPTGPLLVDFVGTKNLVDAAKSAQIQHFVLVTSLCVSRLFHPLNLFFLILVWKKQAEAYVQRSGLTYTIVRPGGLRNDERPDNVIMAKPDSLFEGSIPRRQVAKVCVAALAEPKAKNQIVEIVAKPDAPAQSFKTLFDSIV